MMTETYDWRMLRSGAWRPWGCRKGQELSKLAAVAGIEKARERR